MKNDVVIMDDETYQRLLGFGLHYISIRPRSEYEIREYLQKKIHRWGVSSTLLEKVVQRLDELGYVDDLAFAQAYISSRNQFRPKGRMLLGLELRRKGVDQEVVDQALKCPDSGVSENDRELAQKAATKKLRGLHGYDRREQRNKLYAFLSRRGFDTGTISAVIDGLFSKGLQ